MKFMFTPVFTRADGLVIAASASFGWYGVPWYVAIPVIVCLGLINGTIESRVNGN